MNLQNLLDLLPKRGKADGSMLPIWQSRYHLIRKIVWFSVRLLYRAEGVGPQELTGPALVIFDAHQRSIDAVLTSRIETYVSMMARKDRTLFSFLANYGGGPTFDERRTYHLQPFKRFAFLLDNNQVVGLFPFSDVHNSEPRYVVIRAAMNYEERKKRQITYVTATTVYSNSLRMWPSYWPVPFVTSAKIFISERPILLADLPPEKRSPEGLVDVLQRESARLREKHLEK